MEDKILQLAMDAIAILVPALLAIGLELLRRKLGVETLRKVQKELETKQDLAFIAVKFVEQAYQDYGGLEKFDVAEQWLVARLKERGLKTTDSEITGLIEYALRTLKDTFGEEWANVVE